MGLYFQLSLFESQASLPNMTMFTLQEVPGKGKGVVTTRKILKGTRILSEAPIITVPENASNSQVLRESISRQVAGLPSDQRQAFLRMCNIYPGDNASQYLGIVRTNALPMDDGSGIFITACRSRCSYSSICS